MISEKFAKLVIDEQGLESASDRLRREQASFIRRCLDLANDIAKAGNFSLMTIFSDPYPYYKDGRVYTRYSDGGDKPLEGLRKAVESVVEHGSIGDYVWFKPCQPRKDPEAPPGDKNS